MKQITAGFVALLIVDMSSVAYAQVVDGCAFTQARWSRNILEPGPNASSEACSLACASSAGPAMISYPALSGSGQAPCRGWQYIIPGALGTGMGAVCTIFSWPDEYPPVVVPSRIALCSAGGSLPAKPVTAMPPVVAAPPIVVAPPVVVAPAPRPRVVALPPRVHVAPPRVVHVRPPRIHVHTPRVHAPRVRAPRVHTQPRVAHVNVHRPRVQAAPRVHVNRVQVKRHRR